MKTVGKQLQEARMAKDWTPELAARETKIKVDRLRDLEADDYSHFTSPTYARGFVRTYARSLGLDEYKILRQLDNKLPDDDSANIVTESGVNYLPETAMPPRAAHRDYTGLYIVTALGALVMLVIAFVLFEAYRVGELSRYFGSNPDTAASTTNGTNVVNGTNAPVTASPATARALPVDSNTPPPIVDTTTLTNSAADTTPSVRALPVDSSVVATVPPASNTPTNSADVPAQSVRAIPVDPSELTNSAPVAVPVQTPAPTGDNMTKAPPRALPVSPSELAAASQPPAAIPVATPEAVTPVPAPAPSISARQSNTARQNTESVAQQSLAPVQPSMETTPAAATNAASTTPVADKRLVLTASQDSFVRVTDLDAPQTDKPLYAAVLHSGHSIGFEGRKFSINVTVPSAVDIKLDGVNYGPHSDGTVPETFKVESHLP